MLKLLSTSQGEEEEEVEQEDFTKRKRKKGYFLKAKCLQKRLENMNCCKSL